MYIYIQHMYNGLLDKAFFENAVYHPKRSLLRSLKFEDYFDEIGFKSLTTLGGGGVGLILTDVVGILFSFSKTKLPAVSCCQRLKIQ